jgi:HSP20 family protein
MEETDIPEEGQLTVDIFQDEKNLYVVTPVAGAKVGDIEINLDNDVLTIRGEREKTFSGDDDQYIYKECYWGKFSRSVILPLPVQQNKVKAEFKNNVLKITLPKAEEARNMEIRVKNLDE